MATACQSKGIVLLAVLAEVLRPKQPASVLVINCHPTAADDDALTLTLIHIQGWVCLFPLGGLV